MATIFETERLVVRTLGLDDADACFAIYGDPEVMRYVTTGGYTVPDVELVKQQLQPGGMLGPLNDPHLGFWAIERREDGKVVGTAALIPVEDDDGATDTGPRPAETEYELGWHLAKPHWGNGYAFESGIGLLRYAFDGVELDEVLALAHPDNERSIRACRRLGMVQRESRMTQGHEHVCFAATRGTWSDPSG